MARILNVIGALLYIVSGLLMACAAASWRAADRKEGRAEWRHPYRVVLNYDP
jgi:uncharacterized membrane protein YidH (DUF202 family)